MMLIVERNKHVYAMYSDAKIAQKIGSIAAVAASDWNQACLFVSITLPVALRVE